MHYFDVIKYIQRHIKKNIKKPCHRVGHCNGCIKFEFNNKYNHVRITIMSQPILNY